MTLLELTSRIMNAQDIIIILTLLTLILVAILVFERLCYRDTSSKFKCEHNEADIELLEEEIRRLENDNADLTNVKNSLMNAERGLYYDKAELTKTIVMLKEVNRNLTEQIEQQKNVHSELTDQCVDLQETLKPDEPILPIKEMIDNGTLCDYKLFEPETLFDREFGPDVKQFYQKCPHCEMMVLLDWHKDVTLPDVLHDEITFENSYIVCNECSKKWNENDRLKSIDNGYWESPNPSDETITQGYRFPEYCLAMKSKTVVQLAIEFKDRLLSGGVNLSDGFRNIGLVRGPIEFSFKTYQGL